jgi:hypothetical protein
MYIGAAPPATTHGTKFLYRKQKPPGCVAQFNLLTHTTNNASGDPVIDGPNNPLSNNGLVMPAIRTYTLSW